MTFPRTSTLRQWSTVAGLVVVFCFFAAPTPAHAQCQPVTSALGFNAVSGPCNSTNFQPAFTLVDAYQFSLFYGGEDICQAIQKVLSKYNNTSPGGVVVDARGFNPGLTQACSVNPWDISVLMMEPPSSVVLLPSGTLTIQQNWTLPKDARVIGEGPGVTFLLAAPTGSFNDDGSHAMIEMGTSNTSVCPGADCTGVTVEDLGLNGNGSLSPIQYGIFNGYSQELSYVNNVSITNVAGTGLYLQSKTSANSGPYRNLTMSNVNSCISIQTTMPGGTLSPVYITRGVHGLNCSLPSTGTGGPGISLDSPNNSLEDILISGSGQDGIVIGANWPAPNNALFNIGGSGLGNVIRISNQFNTYSPPPCTPYSGATNPNLNVCNTTILGVFKQGGGGGNAILDQLTNTTLTDGTGVYIVGETIQAGSGSGYNSIGYSRVTTSSATSAAPTWIVGTSPGSSCTTGDLYSRTSGGSSPSTIYVCAGGMWGTAIK